MSPRTWWRTLQVRGRAGEACRGPRIGDPAKEDATVTRFLVPLDLTQHGEGILPAVAAQARAHNAAVLLLHILPPAPLARLAVLRPSRHRPGADEAAALLEVLADRLRAAGISARTLVRAGGVVSTIVQVARQEDADLVILG